MERKDWNRIGIAAAVVLVPGGFLLGAALAARRYARKDAPDDAARVANSSDDTQAASPRPE